MTTGPTLLPGEDAGAVANLRQLAAVASENERDSQQQYHKALATLSAGAVILSVTFVEKLSAPSPVAKWLMLISWLAFAAALMCSLLALRFTTVYWGRVSNEVYNRWYRNQEPTEKNASTTTRIHLAINWSEVLAVGCFMFGVLFLLVFAFVNFQGRVAPP